jgi:glycerol-3-phosphate dehydrogenase (NAD(P)+)
MTPRAPGRSVTVLGAGNWGTTLAHVMATNGHAVTLWTRDAGQCREINELRMNARALPELEIHPGVRAVTGLRDAIAGAEIVVFVVPSQAFREVARAAGDALAPDQIVLHGTKGLELGTHARMSTILQEETCARQIGVLAGPNIATEIARGLPAGTTITSRFPYVIDVARAVLASPRLLVFGGDDIVGVEIASALKNVVAIAAGMAAAMDVGENAKALLVTRGLSEIARIALGLGAQSSTFRGLAGVGDLIVTCASAHSRNHRIGVALARRMPLQDALDELGMVAEGVHAAVAARELAAAQHLETPLLERVYRVLYEGLAPEQAVAELMSLPSVTHA